MPARAAALLQRRRGGAARGLRLPPLLRAGPLAPELSRGGGGSRGGRGRWRWGGPRAQGTEDGAALSGAEGGGGEGQAARRVRPVLCLGLCLCLGLGLTLALGQLNRTPLAPTSTPVHTPHPLFHPHPRPHRHRHCHPGTCATSAASRAIGSSSARIKTAPPRPQATYATSVTRRGTGATCALPPSRAQHAPRQPRRQQRRRRRRRRRWRWR